MILMGEVLSKVGPMIWRIMKFISRFRLISLLLLVGLIIVSAEKSSLLSQYSTPYVSKDHLISHVDFLWQSDKSGYLHVWPEMKFGWKIMVGSFIGFCGAAFGSVGGVGGGGIFVPMLSLIIGFDPKSATAISKCMITGIAASHVFYSRKLRHPILDMPIIDYDLALLFQPMLLLGISIGVAFNVIFADWMVTVLLIIIFLGTSIKALLRGVETWKKENIMIEEAAKRLEPNDVISNGVEYRPLPGGANKWSKEQEVAVVENTRWKEFGLLVFVWVTFLAVQIVKVKIATCSVWYWVLNFVQILVSVGVSLYEAIGLYTGKRIIASQGEATTYWKVHQLVLYCAYGILAGMAGGLLGLGGGFILGPLFLELGVPPQVSSATATFAMTFSSSLSVVEYYLLKRFPVPYALHFVAIATIAAFVGQHAVRKLIIILGRTSIIIFILAFTIFVSAVSLGGVGISHMIRKFEEHEYMGFENLCKYNL